MSDFAPQFIQQVFNGLSLGAVYALIAIGYTMVYGIIGMINFAHGDIYMLGAYVGLVPLSSMICNCSGASAARSAASSACAVIGAGAGAFMAAGFAPRPAARGRARLFPPP